VAGFCNSCGAQLTEGTKFCNQCGAAVTRTAAPAATIPAPSLTPPPATQGSGTVLKVIFAVLGVFALFGVLVAGSCFYIAYRVKKRAHEFNQEMGGNVPPYTGKREPCAMLSSGAAASAIGQPVTSVEQAGRSICTYHFGAGPGQRVDISYTWKGGAMAMDLTHAAMKRVSGTETLTPISGIGDEAFLAPDGSGLMMCKGDVMVNIDLRANGVSTDAAKKMATVIAGNL
jgi:hypothetical protein